MVVEIFRLLTKFLKFESLVETTELIGQSLALPCILLKFIRGALCGNCLDCDINN